MVKRRKVPTLEEVYELLGLIPKTHLHQLNQLRPSRAVLLQDGDLLP